MYVVVSDKGKLTSTEAKIRLALEQDPSRCKDLICTEVLPDIIRRFKPLPGFLDSFVDKGML